MSDSGSKLWFEKASDNLKWAEDNLKDNNFPLVCYLSQQAVELALKGFLYSKGVVPPKSHLLVKLGEVCKENGLDVTEIMVDLAVLSEYYLEARYPDELNRDLDNENLAKEALSKAKKVVDVVSSSL